MRRFWVLLFLVSTMTASLHAGDVIDRVLVVVNNTPILLSDWDEAWRCEALLAGRTPESYSEAERQAVFQRLVDQELLRQQMRTYLLPPVALPLRIVFARQLRAHLLEFLLDIFRSHRR